jgi:AcrR family transcriptional regulator
MSQALSGGKRARTRDDLLVAAQEFLMEQTVADLGIRQIATRAGVVHGSFYNHFNDLAAIADDLADLVSAAHAVATAPLVANVSAPDVRFARITRQVLRVIVARPLFGRLQFDAGLPAGRLMTEITRRFRVNLEAGMDAGCFSIRDLDITASLVAGAISGVALELHRGTFSPDEIDDAVVQLLVWIGVDPARASGLAHEAVAFPPPPETPLRWLSLRPS